MSAEIHACLLVVSKQLRRKKNNEPFLQLQLADATGQVEANIWNNIVEADKAFEAGHVLEIVGPVSTYQNRLQITIERLRRMSEAQLNWEDYPPGTTGKPDEFAPPAVVNYLEPGEWLATDDNIGLAMKSQQRLAEIVQRHTQGAEDQPRLTSSVQYVTPELLKKRDESKARLEEITKRYRTQAPGSDPPLNTRGEDDF